MTIGFGMSKLFDANVLGDDSRPKGISFRFFYGKVLMSGQTLTFDDISVSVGDDSCNGKLNES